MCLETMVKKTLAIHREELKTSVHSRGIEDRCPASKRRTSEVGQADLSFRPESRCRWDRLDCYVNPSIVDLVKS